MQVDTFVLLSMILNG